MFYFKHSCILDARINSLSKAGEIWAWENLGCGCACLEGKDHCGRLDVDCNCGAGIGAKNETGQKLLLWAKKLKSKYSKEKARANRRKKTGFQKGPNAPCVGDENPQAITTKLWKVGTKQPWLKV